MSSPVAVVRSGRRPWAVAVTSGDASPAARAVELAVLGRLQRLHTDRPATVDEVVSLGPVAAVATEGTARRSSTPVAQVRAAGTELPEGVTVRPADLDTPALLAALRGVDALVHVACSTDLAADIASEPRARRAAAVRRTQTLVTAAAAAGVSLLVVVSSAMVYGASRDNAVPLAEDAPLAAEPDDGLVGDLLAVEDVLRMARTVHPGLQVTVVRPAALVGAGVDTVLTRHFEAPRLLTVRGATPAWQFCAVDDLANALAWVVEHRLGPVVTVGSSGHLSQEEVEQISGMRRIELSEALAFGTAASLHRAGVLPTPVSDLTFAVFPWVVPSTTLQAAGWEPAYDNATCLGVLLDGIRGHVAVGGRRVERRDAAVGAAVGAAGAASAAVALVGTAAVMRRRRRRGSGT